MEAVKLRIEEATEQLLGPTNDRDFDQFVKGMIRAFNEVVEVELELTIEKENESDEILARDTGTQSNY